ncbi:MAG: phenylalanine--tRNA ligase subunit beta [Candidatus Undinarchaeales archaeon]|nr:phenylalanine--tRNA ligase subunit beta [Candidatus Undinarchaeales archaeon]
MANVTFNRKDFETLVGKKLSEPDYRKIEMMGTPLDSLTDDEIIFEVFPNRPDLLSVEGFARAVRGFFGIETGLRQYKVQKSDYKVIIDKSVTDKNGENDFWGATAFAVVKGFSFDEESVAAFMQLQEKLTVTIGRRRKKCCIGTYDLRDIKWPLTYKQVDTKHKFVPLGFNNEMTIKECLEKHPRCQEYKHLTDSWRTYPIYVDARKDTLSLLPFTNAEFSKIRSDTTDMFIEVTGNDFPACEEMLNIVASACADRGAEVFEVTAVYSTDIGKGKSFTNPNLGAWKMPLDLTYVNQLLDKDFKPVDVKKELEKMRFGFDGKNVQIPAYRTDIMHNIDIVEDIAIAHGYEKFEPRIPEIPTIGKPNPAENFSNHLRTLMVGLGFQEIVNFVLTNENREYVHTKRGPDPHIEIWNPKAADYTTARTSLAAGLLNTLSMNASSEMPHKIFEVGITVQLDPKYETGARNERRIAAAVSHSDANYSEMKAITEAFLNQTGIKFEFTESKDALFIPGRAVVIHLNGKKAGVMGEVSPEALANFKIEYPVTLFELDLEKLI